MQLSAGEKLRIMKCTIRTSQSSSILSRRYDIIMLPSVICTIHIHNSLDQLLIGLEINWNLEKGWKGAGNGDGNGIMASWHPGILASHRS